MRAQPRPELEPYRESDLVESLSKIAARDQASGRFELAESRYRRALAVDPHSFVARLGLISVLQASGREPEAEVLVARLLDTATGAGRVDALILLAELRNGSGRKTAARSALSEAIALDDDRYDAHQRLADLTGLAPERGAVGDDEALQRAREHPYDPAALVAGARVRVARGDETGALEWLETAVWLADIDTESSLRAAALLSQIDPAWSRRRVVWVHVYADQSVRSEPGWRMRMRLVWRSVSISLDKIMRVAFVPIALEGFQSPPARADLLSIRGALLDSGRKLPSYGLVAVLTDRPAPRRRGFHRQGQAAFLGRDLVVRLTPGEILSRTLLHEVLHIYGGVHVSPDISSLMNPSGESLDLDVANQAIAWLLRHRRFGPGGIKANVLPYCDIDGLILTYLETLRVNLGLRRQGAKAASREMSRYVAAALRKKAVAMDPHLGDVSRMTGSLLLAAGHSTDAADLFHTAARLYGLDSERGRETSKLAASLRAAPAR